MRIITERRITETVTRLCLKANFELRSDVCHALRAAYVRESNQRAKRCLAAIIENAALAKRKKIALCQDTGMPSVFLEIGQEVRVSGDLVRAVNNGIRNGYTAGFLRASIVADPLNRGKPGFVPGIIHTDIVKGRKLKITVLPKGFGCENKSSLKMFNPTAAISEIKRFVIESVRCAGADACPPYIVGIGIGGTADYACLLAKKALRARVPSSRIGTSRLEQELLRAINRLHIGPMGLGGVTTALSVTVKYAPTHIAGLPVAINISCHALRSASATIT